MALPTLTAKFAEVASLPKKQALARWLVAKTGTGSISEYWSLPEKYILAKIAFAYDPSRSLADYISLKNPWLWSAIYNSIKGTTDIQIDWDERLGLGYIAAALRGDDGFATVFPYTEWSIRYQLASIITTIEP
jgi:hypothetical protein